MSGPSFKNIDLWLFELAEGNLSPAQTEQLELFLLQYPEIDVDRDAWNTAKVQPEEFAYPDQDKLIKKRPIGWFYMSSAASIAILFSFLVTDYSITDNAERFKLLSEKIENTAELSKLEFKVAQLKSLLKVNTNKTSMPSSEKDFTDDNSSMSRLSNNGNKRVSREISGSIDATRVNNSSHLEVSHESIELIKEIGETNNSQSQLSNVGYSSKEIIEIEINDKKSFKRNIEDVLAKKYERKKKFPTFLSSDYSNSFKSKLKKAARAFERMMNNPIALTNYRDPSFHLPGKLNNDINFSSAGTVLATRVQAMSRLQWYGKDNEQLINQLAVDGYVYGMRGGVGVQINHSIYKNGAINVSSAALTYSPKISVNRSVSIEPSVRFKMGAKTLNSSKMEGFDQVEIDRQSVYDYYKEGDAPIGSELWYKDLGLGLMVNTKWFYVGGHVDNLFNHHDNMYSSDFSNQHRASHHFIAVAGTDWVSKDKSMGISPYVLYQKNEHLSELWAGANFRYKWFVIGGGISSLLDPGASLELKFEHFSLKYNTDYTMSGMTQERNLSHQLTLKFIGKTSRFGRKILNK